MLQRSAVARPLPRIGGISVQATAGGSRRVNVLHRRALTAATHVSFLQQSHAALTSRSPSARHFATTTG